MLDRIAPDNPMMAYKYLRDKLPMMSETAQRGLVDEVLTEIKDMNAAGTLNARWRTLGADPAIGGFREGEVFAGYRFEAKTGTTLRRPAVGESGDFVDAAGFQWDVKGPLPSAGEERDFNGFLVSIRKHIETDHPNGDERLIVDIAGLSTPHADAVKDLLRTWNPAFYKVLED